MRGVRYTLIVQPCAFSIQVLSSNHMNCVWPPVVAEVFNFATYKDTTRRYRTGFCGLKEPSELPSSSTTPAPTRLSTIALCALISGPDICQHIVPAVSSGITPAEVNAVEQNMLSNAAPGQTVFAYREGERMVGLLRRSEYN